MMKLGQTIERDGIYVLKDGQLKEITPPVSGYGKTTICWEGNKPTRVEHNAIERL